MILWTIQYQPFMEKLERRARVRASWREAEARWKEAYVWMARQMVKRGCCTRPVAPIWAWHSYGTVGQAPDQETVESYCGPNGHTVSIIEFDAPERLVLLSHYGIWNDILDEVIVAHGGRIIGANGEEEPRPTVDDWEQVFCVQLQYRKPWADEGNYHDIQACVPYIDRDWIRHIERYKLPLLA